MDLTVDEFDELVRDKNHTRHDGNYKFEPYEKCPKCGEYQYVLGEVIKTSSDGILSGSTTSRTLAAVCKNCMKKDTFAKELECHPERPQY